MAGQIYQTEKKVDGSSEWRDQHPRNRTQQSKVFVLVRLVFGATLALLLSYYYNRRRTQGREQDLLANFQQHLPDEYAVCSSYREHQSTTAWRTASHFLNGRGLIHSLAGDKGSGTVDCFIVQAGRLTHSGDEATTRKWCESRTPACKVRLVPAGYSVMPSFTDAHGHLLALGQSLLTVDLTGATSLRECIERIEQFVQAHPALRDDLDRWIEGNGWDQTRWNDTDGKGFPTSADLSSSQILSQRKISLKRIDFHALWLSPKAMQDVTENGRLSPLPTPDGREEIPGGLVVRDGSTGRPTGILIDNAMQLALDVIPPWTDADRKEYLNTAQNLLFSYGITGVGDAAASMEDISFYRRAEQAGNLGLRVYAFLACPTGQHYCAEEATKHLLSDADVHLPFKNEDAASKLTIRTVKLFADGALGSWGSAMWKPYSDRPSERGLLLMEESEVPKIVRYWHERGWQIATHAIGDRANSIVLDAYESLLANDTDGVDIRPRIEHVQLLRPSDIPRFTHLGVIPSMQPTHCTSDFYYVADRIGETRSAHGAYAWRSLFNEQSSLIFGSDFPVESPNVLEGLWAAVSRLDREGNSPFGRGVPWHGKERVELTDAVRAFTSNAALGQFQEAVLGSLERGKWADFILVKGDLFDRHLKDPRQVSVVGTALAGQWVWKRST